MHAQFTIEAKMTEENSVAIAVIVIWAIAVCAAIILLSFYRNTKVRYFWPLPGLTILFGVAVWFLTHYGAGEPTCGPDAGTILITKNLTEYGFGARKHLIIVNLTDLGGVGGIHDDDKKPASMQTWIDGKPNSTRLIGVEQKGKLLQGLSFKIGLSIETQDATGDGVDTQFTEFGFQREYEDYVLRREWDDKSFVKDGAIFNTQKEYYEHVMVEVIYLVGAVHTYEGVFYFVNNPVKKDSIPDAVKFKPSTTPCNESLYIIEWEHDANKPGNLTNYPQIELKYPKQSKLEAAPVCKQYLEDLLTFDNPSQLDFASLADGFLLHQMMLGFDLQYRSMISHVLGGQLRSGPMWDAEARLVSVDSSLMHHWVVYDDKWHRDWYKQWLERYTGAFESAIQTSTMPSRYSTAYSNTSALLKSQVALGFFQREEARHPCVNVSKALEDEQKWHDKRSAWVIENKKTFRATNVLYTKLPWDKVRDWIISGLTIFVAGLLSCCGVEYRERQQASANVDTV
tara:strand:+ start:2508 stop:4043 length:1536 start_codon:yes stop_codon:yes gene_type:complete